MLLLLYNDQTGKTMNHEETDEEESAETTETMLLQHY